MGEWEIIVRAVIEEWVMGEWERVASRSNRRAVFVIICNINCKYM